MIDLNHKILAVSSTADDVQLWPGDITDKTSFFRRALWKTRNDNGHAVCLCTERSPTAERRLSIKGRDHKIWLARFPKTGAGHAANCVWHIPPSEQTGAGSYAVSVVERDGEYAKIKLRFGAKVKGPAESFEEKTVGTHICGGKRSTKTRMTERGLLDFLFEESNLSMWIPKYKRRSWPMVAHNILSAAKSIKWERCLLSDYLVIASGGSPKNRFETIADNIEKLNAAVNKKRRIVLLTELTRQPQVTEGKSRVFVPILSGSADYKMKVFADAAIPERLERRFPIAWKAIESKSDEAGANTRGIALVVCEVVRDNKHEGCFFLNAMDMAIMPVTNEFIPYDSSYERLVAQNLVQKERTFRKPLRYDDRECVLPDFELLDVGSRSYPMEVFGMDTDEYNERKREKIVYYNNVYGVEQWWSWKPKKEAFKAAVGRLPKND